MFIRISIDKIGFVAYWAENREGAQHGNIWEIGSSCLSYSFRYGVVSTDVWREYSKGERS